MKYIKVFEEKITFGHPDINLYNDIKEFIQYRLYLFPEICEFNSVKKPDSVVMIFNIIEMYKEQRSIISDFLKLLQPYIKFNIKGVFVDDEHDYELRIVIKNENIQALHDHIETLKMANKYNL